MTKREFVERASVRIFQGYLQGDYRLSDESPKHAVERAAEIWDEIEKQCPSAPDAARAEFVELSRGES